MTLPATELEIFQIFVFCQFFDALVIPEPSDFSNMPASSEVIT